MEQDGTFVMHRDSTTLVQDRGGKKRWAYIPLHCASWRRHHTRARWRCLCTPSLAETKRRNAAACL